MYGKMQFIPYLADLTLRLRAFKDFERLGRGPIANFTLFLVFNEHHALNTLQTSLA